MEVHVEDHCVHLPFKPAEVIDNLGLERYAGIGTSGKNGLTGNALIRKAYYGHSRYLAPHARRRFQRIYLRGWRKLPFPKWPVDFSVDTLHARLLQLSMNAMGSRASLLSGSGRMGRRVV